MNRKWFLLLAIVGSGLTEIKLFTASAQTEDCRRAQTQYELNQCAELSAKNADRKLNQVYQQVLKKQTPEMSTLLVKAEEDWIKYRDASCAFSRQQFAGGSAESMAYSFCMARLTEQRTQELEGYLKEGYF
ncbi:MAG: lysozyme inhibitor LprI family protein [Leptolyngbya sp. BL-A-14]